MTYLTSLKALLWDLASGFPWYLVFKILFVTAGIENKGISRRSGRKPVAGQFSFTVPSKVLELRETFTDSFFSPKAKWDVMLQKYLTNLSVFQNNNHQFIFSAKTFHFNVTGMK